MKEKVQKGLVWLSWLQKSSVGHQGFADDGYAIIIAVGAAFATLLYKIFSGDDNKIAKNNKSGN